MKTAILMAALCLCVVNSVSAWSECEIVALTILGESRGEGRDGMLAVANVIQTRSLTRGISLSEVCLQPHQFSCWQRVRGEWLNTREGDYALQLADVLVAGQWLPDITDGATHYHTTGCHPNWADSKKITFRLKNHVFYRLDS